jgi:hypothetical protein
MAMLSWGNSARHELLNKHPMKDRRQVHDLTRDCADRSAFPLGKKTIPQTEANHDLADVVP